MEALPARAALARLSQVYGRPRAAMRRYRASDLSQLEILMQARFLNPLTLRRMLWEVKDFVRRIPDAWAVLLGSRGIESDKWY